MKIDPKYPPDAFNFVHHNLAAQWFDGLPIGNGEVGALMLPDHRQTTFQLARSDIWDRRCDNGNGKRHSFQAFRNFAELSSLVKAGKWDEIDARFLEARLKWKGKFCLIPAAHLILDTARFEHEIEILRFTRQLDMEHGLALNAEQTRVRRQTIEALSSVKHGVIAIQVKCSLDPRKGDPFRAMTFGMDLSLKTAPSDPEAKVTSGENGNVFWRRVQGYYEVDYTVAVRVEGSGVSLTPDRERNCFTVAAKNQAEFVIYVTISTHDDAIRKVNAAAKAGYASIKKDHLAWWKKFWAASQVTIPETTLLRQYHFGLYLLGSSSRRGVQMPGLQGLWPSRLMGSGWNEYTNDLNIEMNYWPLYTSNHLELAWPYYDTVRGWIPEVRRHTREYYGCRGLQFSCCSSPEGIMPMGYLPTCHWASHAAFISQLFWWHYLYSKDEAFLREVAHPFLIECALFYLDFLKKDKKGIYQIPVSSNPEAAEGGYEAWGSNPAVDIAYIQMLLSAVVSSARVLGRDGKIAEQCQERLDHLPSYPTRKGALIEMESKEFLYSQRHTGMLSAIYPCDELIDRKMANASYDAYLAKGKELWGCHSVPWAACVTARLGRGEESRDWLREFIEVYTVPQGGFNLNYDYHRTGKGLAGKPVFCNESNSGYSASLLEMLLQSHKNVIRVFPAVPKDWKEISFRNLRAQGAFLVSATRKKGKITEVALTAERGGEATLKNPWTGKIERLDLRKGQTIRLTAKSLRGRKGNRSSKT